MNFLAFFTYSPFTGYPFYCLFFDRKRTMKVVPFPSMLSNVTVPFNASVMRLTTANPKRCPFDLVVKNGVKSFGLTLSLN